MKYDRVRYALLESVTRAFSLLDPPTHPSSVLAACEVSYPVDCDVSVKWWGAARAVKSGAMPL